MLEQTVLSDTKQDREALFMALYKKAFPAVAKYVSRRNGTLDEAKDIFQDALLIYYEKTVSAPIALKSSREAYLLGIARNLWHKRYLDHTKNIPLKDAPEMAVAPGEENASSKKLMQFLETTGAKCMELLRAFYYDQIPLQDVATLFGFSGTRSATVQKYKCVEKIRNTVKQKSMAYEDFLE